MKSKKETGGETLKSERKLLSYDNKKLGRIASFSLPTTSCKAEFVKKQGCNKYCYAKRMENRWTNCKRKWNWNLKQTLSQDFIPKMTEELCYAGDIIRIHVSGDFYSQVYFDKWVCLAKIFPYKTFYVYTKNLDLDFTGRPDNFKVLLSDDSNIFPNHHSKFDGVTCIKEQAINIPPRNSSAWTLCPATNSKTGVTCPDCKLCWTESNPRVMFKKH